MGKKLLVADDSVTIHKVIKLALSSEGYEILTASSGTEALETIASHIPDIVLVDVALPDLNAYSLKSAVNQNPKAFAVGFILMAAAFDKIDEQAIQSTQFHGRLVKPFDPAQLRKVVSDVLRLVETLKEEATEKFESSKTEENTQPILLHGKPTTSLQEVASYSEVVASSNVIPLHESPTDTQENFAPVEPLQMVIQEEQKSTLDENELLPIEDLQPTVPAETNVTSISEAEFNLNIDTTTEPAQSSTQNFGEQASSAVEQENDIRSLTESTIKMSGLDEFQWDIDDNKSKKEIKLAPQLRTVPTPPPFKKPAPPTPTKSNFFDDGGSNFLSIGLTKAAQIKPVLNAAVELPLSRSEIEQIIHKDVELILEKALRENIAVLAENIIKQEIEKILSDP